MKLYRFNNTPTIINPNDVVTIEHDNIIKVYLKDGSHYSGYNLVEL